MRRLMLCLLACVPFVVLCVGLVALGAKSGRREG